MQLIAATLLTLAVCAQAAADAQDTVIRLPLIRKSNGQLANIKQSLLKRESTAPLYNALGREYLIEVGVGTPAQKFNLTLDTGSGELWVPSTKCPAIMCPYERFDSAKSTSFKATTTPFAIEYGVGSANGTYGIETITVGGAKVTEQMIGLVSATESILGIVTSGEQSNGILGLGYPGLNTVRGAPVDKPFVFNLGSTLSDPVFSIFLNSHFAYGATGEIMFGGIDAAKYTGSLGYVPVVSYDVNGYYVTPNINTPKTGTFLYWTVPGQGVQAGTYTHTMTGVQGFILDTGTTLTLVPQDIADGIATALGNGLVYDIFNGVYRCECALAKSKATVDFMISTSTTGVSAEPVKISTPVSELVIPLDTDTLTSATKACMFGITSSGDVSLTTGQTWILGESVLRSVYTVYDMKENRVGIAPVNLAGAKISKPINSVTASNGTVTGGTNSTTTGENKDPNKQSADDEGSAAHLLTNTFSLLALTLATFFLSL